MKTKASVSLILGIASVALGAIECFAPIVILGMIIGVSAIVFGIISFKEFKERSLAGIILGATGLIIALIWLHMMIIVK